MIIGLPGNERRLTTPLDETAVRSLTVGDRVLLNGSILTGRDAAHRRFLDCLAAGTPLPVDLAGQAIYYVGPTPAPPDRPIGAAGPTTSGRMDAYAPDLIARCGLRAMIGKGPRSAAVIEAMKKHGCVYLAAVGGAGALLGLTVEYAEVVAYDDLGPEAVHRLEVADFPCVVAIDCQGRDLYTEGPAQWKLPSDPA